jgi:hypothetical protein
MAVPGTATEGHQPGGGWIWSEKERAALVTVMDAVKDTYSLPPFSESMFENWWTAAPLPEQQGAMDCCQSFCGTVV